MGVDDGLNPGLIDIPGSRSPFDLYQLGHAALVQFKPDPDPSLHSEPFESDAPADSSSG